MNPDTINAEAPQGAPSIPRPDATVMSAGTSSPPSSGKPKKKTYILKASGKALPKRVEKLIRQHLLWKAKGNECYEKSKGLLKQAMKETTGRGEQREPLIKPGIVYAFSAPVTMGESLKRTFQIMDNFAMDDVSKPCRFDRFTINTWTGDGPSTGRAALARDNAEQSEG